MAKSKQKRAAKKVNKALLKAVMVREGFTQYQLAQAIGTSSSRFSLKVNGKVDFNHTEIVRIINILKPSLNEAADIFLLNCF